MNHKLYAPPEYWAADVEVKKRVTNGCGPGGWKFDIIPDSIYGLSIHQACDIHDWMYTVGSTLADKDEADRVFLNNVLRLIQAKGGWLQYLRMLRARTYYNSVHWFGGPAFWAGKNPKENLQGEVVNA